MVTHQVQFTQDAGNYHCSFMRRTANRISPQDTFGRDRLLEEAGDLTAGTQRSEVHELSIRRSSAKSLELF